MRVPHQLIDTDTDKRKFSFRSHEYICRLSALKDFNWYIHFV